MAALPRWTPGDRLSLVPFGGVAGVGQARGRAGEWERKKARGEGKTRKERKGKTFEVLKKRGIRERENLISFDGQKGNGWLMLHCTFSNKKLFKSLLFCCTEIAATASVAVATVASVSAAVVVATVTTTTTVAGNLLLTATAVAACC